MKLDTKKTVRYSLKAPESLAERMSGNDKRQAIRSKFMRDRDRILYSKAFRRLSGKTQVFLSGVDDHKRTRLTHTLEVSQIARTISHNLNLDVDLTEAIALGHDIGHTPYGHAGERILHEIMTQHTNHAIDKCPLDSENDNKYNDFSGFKHNLQSVKIAMRTEKNYGEYGLDLTNFTLFGLQFHSSPTYKENKIINPNLLGYYSEFSKAYCINGDVQRVAWSFEAFVVKEADEIAQRHHDLEDAIRGNLITKREVCDIINSCFKDYLHTSDRTLVNRMKSKDDEFFIADMSRIIVNLLVGRLVKCSTYNMNFLIEKEKLNSKTFPPFLVTHNPKDPIVADIISYEKIDSPDNFQKKLKEFQEYISNRVLASYDIQRADSKGRYIIRKLFQAFYTTPQQLPNHSIIEFMLITQKYNSYEDVQSQVQKFGMGHIRNEFEKSYKLNQSDDGFKVKLMRVICDYIAGMTDFYASNMYQQLYS